MLLYSNFQHHRAKAFCKTSSTHGFRQFRIGQSESTSQSANDCDEETNMRYRTCLTVLGLAVVWPLASVANAQVVKPDAHVQEAARVAFVEGPAWHPSDGSVYFSDIANSRIMRLDKTDELHVVRQPSGRTNGLLFDHEGRLVCCEGGGPLSARRVTRIEPDGSVTVLAERFGGKRLNSPNDLTMDRQGRIYFSDPRYGARTELEQLDDEGREIEGVYRIDGPGKVTRILTHEIDRPNGVAVSPDNRFLYVADNVTDGPRGIGGNRKLWRFDLKEDGTVDPASRKLMFDWGTDRGPDGMTIDEAGRLYVAAGFNTPDLPAQTSDKYKAGVYVISPEGKLLQFIAVPLDMVTNCTFGGPDHKTLYITAGHKLWKIPTKSRGFIPWLTNEKTH